MKYAWALPCLLCLIALATFIVAVVYGKKKNKSEHDQQVVIHTSWATAMAACIACVMIVCMLIAPKCGVKGSRGPAVGGNMQQAMGAPIAGPLMGGANPLQPTALQKAEQARQAMAAAAQEMMQRASAI
jgi:hypothetical protein